PLGRGGQAPARRRVGLVLDGAAPRAARRAGPLPAGVERPAPMAPGRHPRAGPSRDGLALGRHAGTDLSETGPRAPPPHRTRGGTRSRRNAKKDLTFETLDPKLVVEVPYDHMEGRRFRHT